MKYNKSKYYKYLRSVTWKNKRQEAFKLHGEYCKYCGATEQLEINHKHYRNIFKEDVLNDLEVLCAPCHRRYHGRVYKAKNERKKQFKKRQRNFRRIFQGGTALTMDEYRRQETRRRSTNLK
jgi:5-methylcytosine-specific restriction endonuclease McrA